MGTHVGDRIVVESERASQPSRAGVIEEVLREEPPRVRVRWEDGHTSILALVGLDRRARRGPSAVLET